MTWQTYGIQIKKDTLKTSCIHDDNLICKCFTMSFLCFEPMQQQENHYNNKKTRAYKSFYPAKIKSKL